MIKFALRRNLIHVLQYIIWSVARDILVFFMDLLFKFNKSYIFANSLFLGELLAGAIMYLSLKKYNKKKKFNISCQSNCLTQQVMKYHLLIVK